MSKKIIWTVILIFIIGGTFSLFYFFDWIRSNRDSALDFNDCIQSGFPTTEKSPRECKDGYGKIFIEDLGNVLEKNDLIKLSLPLPNSENASPLVISGQARGYWFFEGSFPIQLKTLDDKVITRTIAKSQGEWMTEDFVNFDATLHYSVSTTTKAILELDKDNPSGLDKFDDLLSVPILLLPNRSTSTPTSTSKIIN